MVYSIYVREDAIIKIRTHLEKMVIPSVTLWLCRHHAGKKRMQITPRLTLRITVLLMLRVIGRKVYI
jgi:hypothetical protein